MIQTEKEVLFVISSFLNRNTKFPEITDRFKIEVIESFCEYADCDGILLISKKDDVRYFLVPDKIDDSKEVQSKDIETYFNANIKYHHGYHGRSRNDIICMNNIMAIHKWSIYKVHSFNDYGYSEFELVKDDNLFEKPLFQLLPLFISSIIFSELALKYKNNFLHAFGWSSIG